MCVCLRACSMLLAYMHACTQEKFTRNRLDIQEKLVIKLAQQVDELNSGALPPPRAHAHSHAPTPSAAAAAAAGAAAGGSGRLVPKEPKPAGAPGEGSTKR